MTTAELTRRYRRSTLALRAATLRDLQRLWPAFRPDDPIETFTVLLAGVEPLVQRDRTRADGLASAYLQAHRQEAGVPGPVDVRLAESAPAEQVARSLHFTTVGAVQIARRAGKTLDYAASSARVQTMGSVGRLVLNAGRETVLSTVNADRRILGWQRVTSGGCEWCRMLAGRGAAYKSEGTSSFDAHDHCVCSAEPVYR